MFFAIAQIVGALGPAFYGALIGDGSSRTGLFIGYLVGAGIMIDRRRRRVVIGINAEGKSLEDSHQTAHVERSSDGEPAAATHAAARLAMASTSTESNGRLRRRDGAGHRAGHLPGGQHDLHRPRRVRPVEHASTARCSCPRSSRRSPAVAARGAAGAPLRHQARLPRGPRRRLVSMVLCWWPARSFTDDTDGRVLLLLLVATAFLGAGFGLTVPR